MTGKMKWYQQLVHHDIWDYDIAAAPTLIEVKKDGKVIPEAIKREHVEIDEIEMAAREHGIAALEDVAAAILEVDGSISIIPKTGEMHRSRRRFRQFRSRP